MFEIGNAAEAADGHRLLSSRLLHAHVRKRRRTVSDVLLRFGLDHLRISPGNELIKSNNIDLFN